jgi:arylformamidase
MVSDAPSAPLEPDSPAWLDQQYNPRINVSDVPAIFSRWKDNSEKARSTTKSISARAATLIFIHGGYWRAMDKSDFSFIAESYLERGVNIALTNYDLCPNVSIATICLQQANAFAWLYQNSIALGLDPTRIFASGHSAGGHLAAMMSVADWPLVADGIPNNLIKGCISLSGLFDLRPIADTPFLTNELRLTQEEALRVSPALMNSKSRSPILLAVGEKESAEFHRQSALLATAWQDRSLPILEISTADHFSICDEFAADNSPLFSAAMNLINGVK